MPKHRSSGPEKGTAPGRNRGPDNPTRSVGNDTPVLFRWQRCLRDSDLSPSARHVALALSTYMNIDGGSAFPGAKNLAHDTGKSVNRVRKHLAQLVAHGWLIVVEHGGLPGEKRRANRYQAAFPDPRTRTSTPTPNDTRAVSGGGTPTPNDTGTPTPIGTPTLIEQPIGTSHKRNGEEEKSEDQPLDALTSRCFKIFAPNGASEHDCVVAIDQLRDENIADSVIDMALGQCDGNGRHIHYLAVVARNWYAQRAGRPS
jgi:Helix-turn-helix domain